MGVTLIEWAAPTPAERQERVIQAAAARRGTPFVARLAAQVEQVEHEQFMAAHFPKIAAAGYVPGPDATPISDRKSGTPATNPPIGNVSRPTQRPPSAAPAAYWGPAVPPATPSVQVTQLGPQAPATTLEDQRQRRLGFPMTAAREQVADAFAVALEQGVIPVAIPVRAGGGLTLATVVFAPTGRVGATAACGDDRQRAASALQLIEGREHGLDGVSDRLVSSDPDPPALVVLRPAGSGRRSSPLPALCRLPPRNRALSTYSSASLMVPLRPSTGRSLCRPGS